jgi:purine-nucleoside/S-methyl-5'-thioadenosine phosphorylase / adenosine deaminase
MTSVGYISAPLRLSRSISGEDMPAMRRLQTDSLVWFQFESLAREAPFVTHGVFSRQGGISEAPYESLNAGPQTADDPACIAQNHARIVGALPGEPMLAGCLPGQCSDVREVTAEDVVTAGTPAGILPGRCDAFITQVSGIALYWAVADCSVILLVDPTHRAIGLTHAGWRGTSEGVVRKTLAAMRGAYGTSPGECLAAIGPTIGPCCYEVDEPVRKAFATDHVVAASARFSTVRVPGDAGGERDSLRLDLAASSRAQLVACGVPEARIEVADLCTGCHTDLFFSHRIEGGPTGRFAVALGLL